MKKISMWISEEEDARLRAITNIIRRQTQEDKNRPKASKADIIRFGIAKICLSHFSSLHVSGEEIERAIMIFAASPKEKE